MDRISSQESPEANDTMPIELTDAAALRVYELITQEGDPELMLRVYITGGGCSGFQYGFAFDKEQKPDDSIVEKTVSGAVPMKVRLAVDALSMMYLQGAKVDYVENLQGAHFVVSNPNAQTTCSCGSSFGL